MPGLHGRSFASVALAATLMSTTALAQQTSGAIRLGLGNGSATDNGAAEDTSRAQEMSGYLRQGLQGGYFIDGEIRNKFVTLTPATSDSLATSRLAGLRGGRDFGSFSLEGFLAYMIATTGDGTSERRVFGVIGSTDIAGPVSVSGLIGYLDGTTGTDDSGLDGMSQFAHAAVEVRYAVNDRLALEFGSAVGAGVMDDDTPRVELALVREISAGANYQFANPSLKGYARATYSFYYQGGENDVADEKRLDAGLIWTFGKTAAAGSARPRMELPRYENWLGATAGVLE